MIGEHPRQSASGEAGGDDSDGGPGRHAQHPLGILLFGSRANMVGPGRAVNMLELTGLAPVSFDGSLSKDSKARETSITAPALVEETA